MLQTLIVRVLVPHFAFFGSTIQFLYSEKKNNRKAEQMGKKANL